MIEKIREKRNTLKSYKIKGDKIIVKFGFFRREEIENTKENIDALNGMLKEQHSKVDIKSVRETSDKYANKLLKSSCIGIATGIVSLITGWWPFTLAMNVALLFSAYNAYKYFPSVSKEEHYDKVEFLLENEKKLNEGIRSQESDTKTKAKMESVDPLTKHAILKEKHEERDVFDINSINNMSLEGLKRLRANLDKMIEASQVQNAEGPVLTNTPN